MQYTRLRDQSAEYLRRREELWLAEIELMQHTERVGALRRQLPAGPVVEDYVFQEGPRDLDAGDCPVSSVRLSELFSGPGRSLVVYQFMYGKRQTSPCPMCTIWIDGWNGVAYHLAQSVDFVIAAAADPVVYAHMLAIAGWRNLRLLSCGDNTFKYDMGSEDAEGNQHSTISVFTRDASGAIRHFCTAQPHMSENIDQRGIDAVCAVWNVLDLTPEGRDDWYPELSYEGSRVNAVT